MPPLSLWLIRSSLCCLAAGTALGGWLLWGKAWHQPAPQAWIEIHRHWLIAGWLLQGVLGVAYWIAPRFLDQRPRSGWAWLGFCLLSAGLLLVVVPAGAWLAPWCELSGTVAFLVHLWPRVKPALTEKAGAKLRWIK